MSKAIGVDASNIRAGGGVTHLIKVLGALTPNPNAVAKIIVYGGEEILCKLPDRDWIIKTHISFLDGNLFHRVFWQQFKLPKRLLKDGCDVLFSPGGTLPRRILVPAVTMSQNMLPFELGEMKRFGVGSLMWLKLVLLRWSQSRSMQKADGLIFLTEFAKEHVLNTIKYCNATVVTIPHGIEDRFFQLPRRARPIQSFAWHTPFKLLYVSIVDVYKHQWQLAKAVSQLRKKGLPVIVEFIGPANPRALKVFMQTKKKLDMKEEFIFYKGPVEFEELHAAYHDANAFVFASSCENLPNILLEAMASGLPIASSMRGPMPEILGENGVYFDPENEMSISDSLEKLIESPSLREHVAHGSYVKAKNYSWSSCADHTFEFISKVADSYYK